MTLRLARILLVAAVAFFYTLVVFNNITDYGSNYQFVHHVLLMDTIFPGNGEAWRAIHSLRVQTIFYCGIISWEGLTAILTWIGVVQLISALRKPSEVFHRAKRGAVIALTFGMLLWFTGFITVGGEWFLMWQSQTWHGQEAAFRMFASIGIVLILLVLPESEAQP